MITLIIKIDYTDSRLTGEASLIGGEE